MDLVSRRDKHALEQLLPFIDREITVDPEQQDPARRATRRQDVAHAKILLNEERRAEEARKDNELRVKLDGARTGNSLRPNFNVEAPPVTTLQPRIRSNVTLGSIPPAVLTTKHRADARRKPLTTILNPTAIDPASAQGPPSHLFSSSVDAALVSTRAKTLSAPNVNKALAINAHSTDRSKLELTTLVIPIASAMKPRNMSGGDGKTCSVDNLNQASARPGEKVTWLPDSAERDNIGQAQSQRLVHEHDATASYATAVRGSRLGNAKSPHAEAHQVHRSGATVSDVATGARICFDPQHRGPNSHCDLLHRKDFEVKQIRKKLFVDNRIIYVVRWKSTWVPAKLIIEGTEQDYPCVEADGTKWYIKKTLGRREKDGIEQLKARWISTKEPLEMLSKAREAIDLFETGINAAEGDDVAHVRQRRVLTIFESNFPSGSVLPQSEEDFAASQHWVASSWPNIRPHKTLDLYPAIYRIHMELTDIKQSTPHHGKSYRCLMKLPQLRPLRWRKAFLESRTPYRCCRRRRASLFIQATGVQTAHHCTRCLEENIVPFVECVQTAPDQQSWLNGACANCGMRGNLGCDYHSYHKEHPAARPPTPSCRVPHREVNDAFATWENDDLSVDDTDTDSDEDDDDDSEAEAEDSDGHTEVIAKPVFPSFPSRIPVRDFVYHGVQVAVSSPSSDPSSSNTVLDGTTTSSSARSDRRGRLPSVARIKQRLAQSGHGQGMPVPSQSLSIHGVDKDLPACSKTQNGKAAATGRSGASRVVRRTPMNATQNSQGSVDGFEPYPIEVGLLELSFKYDHMTPANSRAPVDALPASAKTMADLRPERSEVTVQQSVPQSSMPKLAPAAISDMYSAAARLESRKRAASLPLITERPSQRPTFATPINFTNGPVGALPSSSSGATFPSATAQYNADKTFLRIRTHAELERDDFHSGCQSGRPCRDHETKAPVPRNPRIIVYHNTLPKNHHATVDEAEYILSRATCHWARKFSVLWYNWCEQIGGIENEKRSQVEWILSDADFRKMLRTAAWYSCPKKVIMVDD